METYQLALIGSLLFVVIRLKIEKQKIDEDNKYKARWKAYFIKEWDDFAFSILAGQGLALIQESLYFSYASWAEWDQKRSIDFYFEAEESIAFCMGLFGSVLVMLAFKYIIKKITSFSKK